MLKSYLITTLRTIRKSPLSSFINIFGLAVGLGVAIMVYAFLDLDLGTDQFHENREEIFLSTSFLERSGEVAQHGVTPAPYAEVLRNDFPQIERVVRIERRTGILKNGLSVFNETFTFTDPGFLDMFTFPLASGDKAALNQPNKIILSHQTAIKYFGDKNPVGEAMTFDFESKKYTFEVAGVAEPFPRKSSLQFSVLVNFEQLELIDSDYALSDWSHFLDGVFIQVKDAAAVDQILSQTGQYVSVQNEVQKDWPATSFGFMPWTRLFIEGENLRSRITGQGDSLARKILVIIASFVLVLAIFNYINIAIVSATKRLKEIGVRKVMGGTRKSLIFQFLTENIVLTLLALIFGFVLAVTLLIPGFDQLFDIGLDFNMNQPELWLFLFILVVFTGLASGAYPALYISNFSAVNIFRGRLKFGGKNNLTKAFLTFQYILAIIAIVGGILFTQNTAYQKQRDWGYDQQSTLGAFINDSDEIIQLKNRMEQHPSVDVLAPAKNNLARSTTSHIIEVLDEKHDIATLEVGPNYIETMGLNLLEGRSLEENRATDFQNILVNEQLAAVLNPNGAIGEQFKIDSLNYTVIGVVEDFHQWSFFDEIEPMMIKLAKEEDYQYLMMQVNASNLKRTYEDLKATWAELFPDKPFNGFYQETELDWYFQTIDGHGKLMRYVAFICIILSCLGLYGLVSLNVASRTKEFSIRKALGATLKNLILVINKQFVVFLLIALCLGLPISYLLLSTMFDAVYAFYKPITILPFIVALVMVVLMVFITVSSLVKKVMTTSPTEGLRSE
ncbi:ABC transporter permease [Roseivirga pacifica]|uniref:ABC transporter permease n=1 Tax=Roseivirga pacifica TaxID=1267423 RepID=UPI003BB04871